MSFVQKIILLVLSMIIVFLLAIVLINQVSNNNILTFNVIFETGGGTIIKTQTVKNGDKVIKPHDPKKEGYIFIEWQLDNVPYDFSLQVSKNIKLVAKWEKKSDEFVVTFDTAGGTNVENQIIKKDGKIVRPADPVKEGYIFDGWSFEEKTYNFDNKVVKNVTLVAVWKKNNNQTSNNVNTNVSSNYEPIKETIYNINFDSDGGSYIQGQTVKAGGKIVRPADPVKEGYIFENWYLNGDVFDFNTIVMSDVTLVAKWKSVEYIIEAIKIDNYSPDRLLIVKKGNDNVEFKRIMYLDGTTICSGSNPAVSLNDIIDDKVYKVELFNGNIVNATLK